VRNLNLTITRPRWAAPRGCGRTGSAATLSPRSPGRCARTTTAVCRTRWTRSWTPSSRRYDREGAEIDARVADIEDLAGMGRAEMPLTAGDVRQLAEQAAAAVRSRPGQAARPGRSAA
jgi:hypothetical protein